MGAYTRIPADVFNNLQLDAGVIVTTFDPTNPSIADSDIITATTGGIQISVVPTYSDVFEDVDNAPLNTKEGKHLDSWEVRLSTTSLSSSKDIIKRSLGAADVSGNKITPRAGLEQGDFADIWWVGDKADGGWAAAKIMNSLSTGGLQWQTSKNGKGQTALEIMGHPSISSQTVVPAEFYVGAGG